MFNDATAQRIEELLSSFLVSFSRQNQHVSDPPSSPAEALQFGAVDGSAAPFHFALFPEIVRFKTLERSFSSNLGSVFERIAYEIGRETFAVAEQQHHVTGRVRANVIAQIDQIIKDYETIKDGKRLGLPDMRREHEILDLISGPGGDDYDENVDLYLKSHEGVENYFHMKTIKPNKDQSNKAKRLMLLTLPPKTRPRLVCIRARS